MTMVPPWSKYADWSSPPHTARTFCTCAVMTSTEVTSTGSPTMEDLVMEKWEGHFVCKVSEHDS